jgi:Cu/Zn superoxide dismutase
VPRFRTLAVAALAAPALLLTSGAAYAGDHDLHRRTHLGNGGFGGGAEISSMSWGSFKGDLSDLSTTDTVFDRAKATAFMMSLNGESTFRLHVRGLDESAAGKQYPAHLHEGPCVAGDGAAAGGHYNTQKEAGLSTPWLVSHETEVHLDFTVNSEGSARVTVAVPFVPKPGERSIVIHSDQPPVPPATSPARWACLPLQIKAFSGTN